MQNLAAVPVDHLRHARRRPSSPLIGLQHAVVLGGAIALALLILPVIIIATREALRAVPREIRDGSLALGATRCRRSGGRRCPSAVPGIATGTILALSRALGEAAPLLLLGGRVLRPFDPNGLLAASPRCRSRSSTGRQSQEEFQQSPPRPPSSCCWCMLLLMNALAIVIRNKYQRRW